MKIFCLCFGVILLDQQPNKVVLRRQQPACFFPVLRLAYELIDFKSWKDLRILLLLLLLNLFLHLLLNISA